MTLEELIRLARELPPMTKEQEREQVASFTFGNLALMREHDNATPEQLGALRQLCRKVAGCA